MTQMTMNRKYYSGFHERNLQNIVKVKTSKAKRGKGCGRMSLTHVLNSLHPFGAVQGE
jgi:hypothetical protein